MQRLEIKSTMTRVAMTLVMMLTTATGWADSWTEAGGTGGSGTTDDPYYVNMSGTINITIPSAITSFHVYDNGGKNKKFAIPSDDQLTLTAPDGYVLHIAGEVVTNDNRRQYLHIYEGTSTDGTQIASASGYGTTNIDCTTEGESMTITFYAVRSTAVSGYDLTVTVYKPDETFPITIDAAVGGIVASSVGGASANSALYGDVVTLTATPASGYLLNDIIVTDADNNSVTTLGAWYTGNTATFTMPNVAVTVSPTFTTAKTADGGLYIRMPKSGSVNDGIIPEDVQSFKVYDDGGASAPYSAGSNGTITLTAPTGYILRMMGSIVADNDARLNVYDGSDTDAAKLIDNANSGNVLSASTGQSITIQYTAGSNGGSYAGLDLTINLTTPDEAYAIGIDNPAAGGIVIASVGGAAATSASAGQTVTLTAAPANGYLLSAISMTDEVGRSVALTDMRWHTGTNTATFTMPFSAVSIVPTFTDKWTADGGLYINMPTTGSKATTIPEGVTSFKVYDDGGKDGNYSGNCDGTLTLTAPAGHVLLLSGSIDMSTIFEDDYLTVYDGDDTNATELASKLAEWDYEIPTIGSSGESMTLYFHSDNSYHRAGLDLTVTIVQPTHTITMNNPAVGGTLAASVGGVVAISAKGGQTVTLTATPASGYLLSDVSVTDADNNSIATLGAWYTANTATFTMPYSDVTVTSAFTNNWTADGGLYISIPKTGSKTATIPEGVTSFKVYNDGGRDGNYYHDNGTLTLTAPAGCMLEISGSSGAEGRYYHYLTIYDNSEASGTELFYAQGKADISPIVSSGNVMTIRFYSNNNYNYDVLNLDVRLVNPNTQHTITVNNPVMSGTVTASVGGVSTSSATVNQTVTLTASPASGYLFSGVSVQDVNSHDVAVTLDDSFCNTATFKMPNAGITVIPTFTDNWTADGGLYINMPATGSRMMTIPDGVQSFKVYDDGGAGGYYSNHCNGILTLTAPAGCVLQLSGSVTTMRYDALNVYDNSEASGSKLLDAVGSSELNYDLNDPIPIPSVTTSGNVMTLCFYSDESNNFTGLDLTVTVLRVVSLADLILFGYNDDPLVDGSAEHPFVISTDAGWNYFCDALQDNDTWNRFSGKTVKLGKDITVTRMAGSDNHDFCGTFDGGGYTITLDGNTTNGCYALFRNVSTGRANPGDAADSPAAIRNLHVDGTIVTASKYAAGLISGKWGDVTIENCRSSVTIKSSVGGDGTHAGFVAVNNNGKLNIKGCVFDGKLLTTGTTATAYCGGFVGWRSSGDLNITNSLYAPAVIKNGETEISGEYTFARNGVTSISNSFYTRLLGTAQGLGYSFGTAPANIGTAGTAYSVSGITPYTHGIAYDNRYYMTPETLTFVDNADNDVAAIDGYFATVTLSGRTLWKDGDWNTLCLPFDVSTTSGPLAGDGVVAMTLNTASSGLSGTTLTLNFTETTTIPAGTPFIIKWGEQEGKTGYLGTTIENPVFTGVTIDNTMHNADFTGGTFKGTYSPIVWDTENKSILFVGTNNTLYWPTTGGHVNACRAYFDLGSASAREFVMYFDGENEVNGVKEVKGVNGVKDDSWYTVNGVKLSGKPTKSGLYIHGNRKVVIK